MARSGREQQYSAISRHISRGTANRCRVQRRIATRSDQSHRLRLCTSTAGRHQLYDMPSSRARLGAEVVRLRHSAWLPGRDLVISQRTGILFSVIVSFSCHICSTSRRVFLLIWDITTLPAEALRNSCSKLIWSLPLTPPGHLSALRILISRWSGHYRSR